MKPHTLRQLLAMTTLILLWGCAPAPTPVPTVRPTAIESQRATVAPTVQPSPSSAPSVRNTTPTAPSASSSATAPKEKLVYVGTDGNLWITDAEGTKQQKLEIQGQATNRPVWSPDGKQIAFTCAPSKQTVWKNEICIIGEDGGNQIRLLHSDTRDFVFPDWHPDGKSIIFEIWESPAKPSQIGTVDLSGKNLMIMTEFGVHASQPIWRPSGKEFAYFDTDSKNEGMYLASADGKSKRFVARASVAYPAWSPDGNKIVFDCQDVVGICVLSIDGSIKRIHSSFAVAPAWSPNGDRIAFIENNGVYIMSANGANVSKIADNAGGGVSWHR